MERLLVILFSAAVGTAFYIWFSHAVNKKQSMGEYIMSHQWLLHPNSICYWRTAMAILGFILYFYTSYQSMAIFIFTFAAILDGADGVVARGCNLGSPWGEWLDPMCDKLTYLPPLIGFDKRIYLIVIGYHQFPKAGKRPDPGYCPDFAVFFMKRQQLAEVYVCHTVAISQHK